MRMSKRLVGSLAAAALLSTTAACVTNPETGERSISTKGAIGTAVGAVVGYFGGDLIGGRRDRTEKIVGAGIGAIAGGALGTYMDRQEKELRDRTAGTGVEIDRQGNELLLTMPAGITFPINSAEIQPQFQSTLDQVAQTLSSYPSTMIDVYGHTDPSGGDAINIPLSQRRAQSVASYLSARGVQSARIATQGFGSSQPLAGNDNSTEAERAANRRVEIRIVPVEANA
ncbi:glycine zipper 2TM domain-containing protein [Sphingomonas parva]|uniref:Glycine zipper 2TM domain-containing protein n=1 Tax=Sphingomonas parva TaxID=2555898 RepID=A0A4Y8ZYC2_9SPHN|nr:OmpA family protein [Sphingomonas parva]TFI59939.1 glycine zipper 2TM domain-containing protein [Sphingomonas parva]